MKPDYGFGCCSGVTMALMYRGHAVRGSYDVLPAELRPALITLGLVVLRNTQAPAPPAGASAGG